MKPAQTHFNETLQAAQQLLDAAGDVVAASLSGEGCGRAADQSDRSGDLDELGFHGCPFDG